MDKIKTVFIVGPTASGKTGISIELAKIFDAEIVSADSMQIYRGMDIGTAKPTDEEKCGIPHYMIDVCDISDDYSVADYQLSAKKCITDIAKRGKLPIVVGGTGLYVDSLINDTAFADHEENTSVREKLKAELEEYGAQAQYEKLCKIDSESASKLHPNDTKRVMRALECYYLTGKTKTELDNVSHNKPSFCEALVIGLNFSDRELLYRRINERVDVLVKNGLVFEVERLLSRGLRQSKTAYQAIGYKEIVSYIDGNCTLDEAIETLKMNTRRYAKRQLTWFRKNESIHWINIDTDASSDYKTAVKKAAELIEGFR